MAKQVDSVVEEGVEELEKEITCAICHEHYDEPKVLPCCHYFCKQCIHQLTLRNGADKPFSCPECRQDTTLPQGCVDHLKTAFFINRMKGVHSKLERAHGKVKAKCEQCFGDKAEAFCRQCTQFICAECVKQHYRMRTFAGHRTITLDELKEGWAKEIMKDEPPLKMCIKHDEPMKIYCFTCSCLICRDCTIKDHFDHNHEFIKSAAPETKKMLIQRLDPLKKVDVSLSRAIEEIQTTKSEINAQGDSVSNEIKSSFAEYRKIIDNREQELSKEVSMKVTEKLDNLSGQEKSLSTERALVQSVIDYTKQCVEHSSDGEIMCMHGDIQSRIDRETKEHHEERRSLEPVEAVDIGVEVSCTVDLHQLFQAKAKIIQHLIGKLVRMKEDEVNKTSSCTILINGEESYVKCIDFRLKSLYDGSTIKVRLAGRNRNKYFFDYTPTVRGRHELIVTINGKELIGSPFPVFVSIHPTRLGWPVRVITGLKSTQYLAINSVGEIIATEAKDLIVVLDREGKKMRNVKESSNDIDIKHPAGGVAIDETNDNIYFVDRGNKKVIRLNKDLKILNKIDAKEDSSLRGVSVVGDEVMVCDNKNNGILVYTKELEYVREIKYPLCIEDIRDISPDEYGNLYICDFWNSRIYVLSNGGEYLRSFGCDENGVNKLSGPSGIHVASQYVYVTNYSNHTLSVYTTEGEHVPSIGRRGGDFGSPWGVCVDKDGFVYISDCYNDKIHVF